MSDRYRIEYTKNAITNLRRITHVDRERIVKKIDTLSRDPRPADCTPLKGYPGLLRIRVGGYRVIYTIRKNVVTISITAVGKRDQVYKKLGQYLK